MLATAESVRPRQNWLVAMDASSSALLGSVLSAAVYCAIAPF